MTEIILILLLFFYYVFCVMTLITYVQREEKYTILKCIYTLLMVMITAPIVVPIILGIETGIKLKDSI